MSTKDPLIIGNWKMNKTAAESVAFVKEFQKKIKHIEYFNLVICPSFTALSEVNNVLKRDILELGAQDIFYEAKGAFTGEVSPLMLKEFKVKYVLIGHSERRELGETNEMVNKKLLTALQQGFTPVLCIGEDVKQRKEDEYKDFVLRQLKQCLKNVDQKQAKNIVIAYEPLWAISKGDQKKQPAGLLEIEEMHAFIRASLLQLYHQRVVEQMYIIYGGSVKPDNIREILILQDVDGVLPGNASLEVDSFISMIRNC
ncbi:triose-phosphate isomerase [Candidatus Woesearchaeota archaeon]|nr:triose-phosphate isomerase [Candidatus Woesearchaeota archaeon]